MNTRQIQLSIPINFKQIVDIVKQLTPSEKQQLSEVLWIEQNIDDMVIPQEHKQIVRERIKHFETMSDCYLSWSDIENKIAARK